MRKRGKTIATVTYGPLSFAMELPATWVPGSDKPAFLGADIRVLENAAALWIIEHGAVFPQAIRALRAAAELSSSQLASLLGVDPAQVSRWENGVYDPGVAMWNLVADLALEAMQKDVPPRARLEAALSFKRRPRKGEIRLPAVA